MCDGGFEAWYDIHHVPSLVPQVQATFQKAETPDWVPAWEQHKAENPADLRIDMW